MNETNHKSNFLSHLFSLDRPRPLWLERLFLAVIVVLAIVPPALIMADRWMHVLAPAILYDIWCTNQVLCSSPLPSYFLIIFACMILLTGLIFLQRKHVNVVNEEAHSPIVIAPVGSGQRRIGYGYIAFSLVGFAYIVGKSLITKSIPGWDLVYAWIGFVFGCLLISYSLEAFKADWKVNADFYLALLIGHLGIVGLMVGLYGKPDLLWSAIVLFVLAGVNLWRFRGRVPWIYWIALLALVGFCLEINGWQTAVVGDEYNFLLTAINMADRMNYRELGNYIFLSDNLGAKYPFFPSVIQAISMKFMGSENFGWRFSNVYLCALSVGFFYYFCRSFLAKKISLIAAFLFASSSYVMSFSKVGYDNLQALFALSLTLAMVAWTIRSQSKLAFASLGTALALCFYVYPAALYVVPLPLIFLFFYYSPFEKQRAVNWGIMFSVWLALIFPLMLQPGYWHGKVAGTLFNQPTLVQTASALINHFVSTLVYSLLSYLYIFNESHFITSSYVDPLTGAFFLIGLPVLVFQAKRQRFPLFILFTYFFFVFVVGTTHDRDFPPNTRMFLLIPIYALIAAWGISWAWEQIKSITTLSQRFSTIFISLFFILVFSLNLYQAYPLSHYRFANQSGFESLFLRVARQVSSIEKRSTKTFAVIVDEEWGVDGLLMLQKGYPELAYVKIEQIRIKMPPVPEEYAMMLRDRNTFVFFFAGMDQSWYKPLDEQMRKYSKEPCEITTSIGARRFTLYHDPDYLQACNP